MQRLYADNAALNDNEAHRDCETSYWKCTHCEDMTSLALSKLSNDSSFLQDSCSHGLLSYHFYEVVGDLWMFALVIVLDLVILLVLIRN